MKILVIFTGGTIGSKSGDSINLNSDSPYKLIDMYEQLYGGDIDFITESPYQILSENMTCKEYLVLKNCIDKYINTSIDGIILTHGSDTIQYTSAFLHYIYGIECLPIMVVASNYVLNDGRSNGLANFYAAVDFISNRRGHGVFVPYRNHNMISYIHRGNTLLPHMSYSDELYEINNRYYGMYSNGEYFIGKTDAYDVICYEPDITNEWKSSILVIYPYPGMSYPNIPEGITAILHYTYHSGTICVDTPDIDRFIKSVKDKKIPIYIAGTKEGITYDSCKIYREKGFISMGEITPAAAYIKLWLQSISLKRV